MIYFDACYIAKFYLAEPDSANVIASNDLGTFTP